MTDADRIWLSMLLPTWMQRVSHGLLDWHLLNEQPRPQRGMLQTCLSRPFSNRLCLALPCYEPVDAHVIRLLAWRGPSTITRFVIAVIVNPIKRMISRRAWSHVCEKYLKGVTPLIAYADATTTVVMELGVVAIVASRFQIAPCRILLRFLHAVRAVVVSADFAIQTPATLGTSGNQTICQYGRSSTTGASAKPSRAVPKIWRGLQHREAPKSSTFKSQLSHYCSITHIGDVSE